MSLELGGKIERRRRITSDELKRLMKDARDRRQRGRNVAKEVRPPRYSLMCLEIDEQERRGAHRSRARPERSRHGNVDGGGTQRSNRQRRRREGCAQFFQFSSNKYA
jgi:hypothetical protein